MNDPLPPGEGDTNTSPRREAWQERHLDAETRELLAEDARYFLHQSLSTPCLNALEGCAGAHLRDLQGRRYLDFHGNSVHQVGFAHPRVIEAIKRQLDELSFCTRRYTNRPAVELARRLTELAPGDLDKVLFAPGGATAMGIALKLARAATGRFKTLSLWDAFHGAGLDTISIGGEALFRRDIGPLLPGSEHAPPPDPGHCPFECGTTCNLRCARYVDYVLEKEGDVAAVIAETVRAVPYVPPPGYWAEIRAACDRHGALLILDEIPTGLGRTGALFACEHYGVVPDMLVLGKGLGGGVMPLAAVLARPQLDVAAGAALGHYTHEKSPVACAAGLATLDVLRDEGLVERAARLGEHALARLGEMASRHACIRDVRGIGLLLGVELRHASGAAAANAALADEVMYRCLDDGLSFKTSMGSVLTLSPPLTIAERDLDHALDVLDAALTAAGAGSTAA